MIVAIIPGQKPGQKPGHHPDKPDARQNPQAGQTGHTPLGVSGVRLGMAGHVRVKPLHVAARRVIDVDAGASP